MSSNDLFVLLPLVVLIGWAILLLLVDLWIPETRKGYVALLAAIGLVAALVLTLLQVGQPPQAAFNNMIMRDGFALFLNLIFLVSALAGVMLAYDYLKRMGIERGEYYSLLLFTTAGMMLMASAYDLIIVFLALELLSIPLYVLAGFALNISCWGRSLRALCCTAWR
jgi:NADH-quinone oxidoreductase subunit N